jgi:hypothetical protein
VRELTTYHLHVPLSRNLGALTSWNPVGLFRPVMGQLYLIYVLFVLIVLFDILFVLTVLFCVLFVCKYVLYYCHQVSTQLQLTNISICHHQHCHNPHYKHHHLGHIVTLFCLLEVIMDVNASRKFEQINVLGYVFCVSVL